MSIEGINYIRQLQKHVHNLELNLAVLQRAMQELASTLFPTDIYCQWAQKLHMQENEIYKD